MSLFHYPYPVSEEANKPDAALYYGINRSDPRSSQNQPLRFSSGSQEVPPRPYPRLSSLLVRPIYRPLPSRLLRPIDQDIRQDVAQTQNPLKVEVVVDYGQAVHAALAQGFEDGVQSVVQAAGEDAVEVGGARGQDGADGPV